MLIKLKIYKSDAIKQTELIDFDSGKLENKKRNQQKTTTMKTMGGMIIGMMVGKKKKRQKPIQVGKVPDTDTSSEKIVITKIPFELLKLINEFSKYSLDLNYLITSIQALSTIEYPSLANSFYYSTI